MWDKLKQRNKAIIALILVFGCGPNYPETNTEITCPNGASMLVKFIHAKDLRNAIKHSYYMQKKDRTSENFTAIRLPDGRSFSLKMTPEYASTCDLHESKVGEVEQDYIHHF